MRELQSAVAVDISADDVVLSNPSLALLAAADGNIKVDMFHTGTEITLPVKAGVLLRVRVSKVYKTGTTATGIVALY